VCRWLAEPSGRFRHRERNKALSSAHRGFGGGTRSSQLRPYRNHFHAPTVSQAPGQAAAYQPVGIAGLLLDRSVPTKIGRMSRLHRFAASLEWPMALLALLVIPALIMEGRALSPAVRTTGLVLNWTIWVAFVVEFIVRWVADGKASFARRAWFDLLRGFRGPPVDSSNGRRESALGCAADSWRAAEAGDLGESGDRRLVEEWVRTDYRSFLRQLGASGALVSRQQK